MSREQLEVGTGICKLCDIRLDPARPGNPIYCQQCEKVMTSKPKLPKEQCPECGKWVKRIGLDQHLKDSHFTSSAQVTSKKILGEMERLKKAAVMPETAISCLKDWILVNIK